MKLDHVALYWEQSCCIIFCILSHVLYFKMVVMALYLCQIHVDISTSLSFKQHAGTSCPEPFVNCRDCFEGMHWFRGSIFSNVLFDEHMWLDFGKSTTLSHLMPQIFMAENKALHSINRHYSELSFSLYHELPEILWNILISACVLLRQQGKVLGSIYSTHDRLVDFSKSGHICIMRLVYGKASKKRILFMYYQLLIAKGKTFVSLINS